MTNITIKQTFILLLIIVCTKTFGKQPEHQKQYTEGIETDTTIILESAEVFLNVQKCIHAIAFNDDGQLFFAGCQSIYSATPEKSFKLFATIKDTTSNTKIWAMTFDRTGNLFVAAKDRIIKVRPNGKQTTIIEEDFSGPAGATDIRIDKSGNLYVVHGNVVTKYNKSMKKTIVIDGSRFDTPIKWAVGMEFDKNEEQIFLGDCNGKNLYIIPFKESNYFKQSKIIPTNWGQYLCKDDKGNQYITMLGSKSTFPDFLKVSSKFQSKKIFTIKRPLQNREIYKKSIAYNNGNYFKKGLYCIIGEKIHFYSLD